MASADVNSDQVASWPRIEAAPLIVGGSLIGIGAAVALVGLGVVGSHLVAATRDWVNELETPPAQLARLKWEQAKTAAASGASTWREHPNSQVRVLPRRTS